MLVQVKLLCSSVHHVLMRLHVDRERHALAEPPLQNKTSKTETFCTGIRFQMNPSKIISNVTVPKSLICRQTLPTMHNEVVLPPSNLRLRSCQHQLVVSTRLPPKRNYGFNCFNFAKNSRLRVFILLGWQSRSHKLCLRTTK